jgi:hypothetical protein
LGNSEQGWILDLDGLLRMTHSGQANSNSAPCRLASAGMEPIRRSRTRRAVAFVEQRFCFDGTKFESGTLFPFATWSCELVRRDDAGEPIQERQTMTTTNALESRETTALIGSDKVEGTAVYGADDKKIGKLERVMLDKASGKVAYAVLSFGGFLGMGEDYYPTPWSLLKYDTNLGGYRTNLTKNQLEKAPKYSQSTSWNWNRDNDRRVYDYYKTQPYWIAP